jgi:hypothetical protein
MLGYNPILCYLSCIQMFYLHSLGAVLFGSYVLVIDPHQCVCTSQCYKVPQILTHFFKESWFLLLGSLHTGFACPTGVCLFLNLLSGESLEIYVHRSPLSPANIYFSEC